MKMVTDVYKKGHLKANCLQNSLSFNKVALSLLHVKTLEGK